MSIPPNITSLARRYFPILTWGAEYSRRTFTNDLIVAAIVTVMLIPQSLAYALLAGLPPQVGLYASMAPLVLYAIFGTSRTLAVGPVAVASLMTGAAAVKVASQGTPEYLGATIALATISGLLLLLLGLLRLGFLANFLSHPVISGFITASGIQIAAGQLAPVLGIHAEGASFLDLLRSMVPNLVHINIFTATIGFASLAFLFWVAAVSSHVCVDLESANGLPDILGKVGPVVAIAVTTAAVWGLGLSEHGVKIVGTVPKGLPRLTLPPFEFGTLGETRCSRFADFHRRLCRVHLRRPDARRETSPTCRPRPGIDRTRHVQRRRGHLGWISRHWRIRAVGSQLRGRRRNSRGRSIHGSRHRTGHIVSYSPAVLFTQRALAATIIVAVLSLVDLGALKRTYVYSLTDFAAMAATILLTLIEGVEAGLLAGVGLCNLPPPLQHLEATRGSGGADPGDLSIPQRQASRGGNRSRDPFTSRGCKPLFPERPFPRGPCQRVGRS